jgi:hypothetical protein
MTVNMVYKSQLTGMKQFRLTGMHGYLFNNIFWLLNDVRFGKIVDLQKINP